MKTPLAPQLVAACLALSTAARADTVTADFNDNTIGTLGAAIEGNGQAGGSGWLDGDVWDTTDTISVIAGDLTAPAGIGYSIAQGANEQSVQGNFDQGGKHSTRDVAIPLAGTVWFSFLLNQPTSSSRGGITFNHSGGPPGNPRVVATGTEIRLALSSIQPGGEGALDVLTTGQTALVLGRLTIDPGGDEVLEIWVDPDLSGGAAGLPAPDNSLVEQTASLDGGITTLGIQSYSSDAQGGIVDALRISDAADAFDQVTSDGGANSDDPNLIVSRTNPFASLPANVDTGPVVATIAIENRGAQNTLTIADTTAPEGPDAADFTILTALPLDILPRESGTLQVQFTPRGVFGDFAASLELASNDSSTATISVPMSATFAPLLQVDRSNPFEGAAPGVDPDPITAEVELANSGTTTTITIDATTDFTSDNPGTYTILTPLPFDILPGGSADLQVQFDAMDMGGLLETSLAIQSNDPDNETVYVYVGVEVPRLGVNIVRNGDFEHDGDELYDWGPFAFAEPIIPGFAPGDSDVAAQVNSGGFLQQDFLGLADWYADFFFQVPDVAGRVFNVRVPTSGGQINIRYNRSGDGAEDTWNAFDGVTANDSWGEALGLGAITPGATYFMRIVGQGWGGASPTYDLLLSEADSVDLTRSVTGLSRYQNRVVAGAPTGIRFTAEFGATPEFPGFRVDDVSFINGSPPSPSEVEVIGIAFADGNATITWTAQIGTRYVVWASPDLRDWAPIGTVAATMGAQDYTETGITSVRRFYYVVPEGD